MSWVTVPERTTCQDAVERKLLLLVFLWLVRHQPLQDEYRLDTCLGIFQIAPVFRQQAEHIEQTGEPYYQKAKPGIRNFDVLRLYRVLQ